MLRGSVLRRAGISVITCLLAAAAMLPPGLVYADVTALSPNAAGDSTQLTASPAGNNYLRVQTNDGDTSYVVSNNTNTYLVDLYNLDNVALSGTVNNVIVTMIARVTNTGQASAYTVIKTNGAQYNGTAQTLTTAYTAYATTYNVNPNTGLAWTWTEVNNLQAGVALRRAANNRFTRGTQVYVTVNYTPPVVVVPTVATGNATSVEETTTTLNGTITNTGGVNADSRGFEWDVDSGTPYANNWSESGSFGIGAYTYGPTSLTKGTLYYFRARAHNSAGWGYGTELKFLTKPDEPNAPVATPGNQQVQLTWTKGSGAQTTIIRGKIGSYPSNYNSDVAVYNGSGTSANHSGLNNGEHWYYRAWSYTADGGLEQYSDLYVQADAIPLAVPALTTGNATSVEETTATINGTLNNDGGEACQYRFEYDTDSGAPYSFSISWTGNITSGQSFSANITGLDKGTKYYFIAEVKNSAGTVTGSELHLLTKPDEPVSGSFTATTFNSTQIDLSWVKGNGANRTMVRGKEGSYPTDVADGREVYFNTGTSVTDAGLYPATTYYYRAWSEVTGSQQWSDSYIETSATTSSGPSPPPVTVGGTIYPVNKLYVLLPWLSIAGILLLLASFSRLRFIKRY